MAKSPLLPGLFANSARRFVRATLAVQAGVGNSQPLHGLTSDDVLFDNVVYIRSRYSSVPDGFRINHHRGAVLALIETARLVRPHRRFYPSFGQAALE